MTLRIGFAKGRGAVDAMALLEAGGVALPEAFRAARIPVHAVPDRALQCFVLRGEDLPELLASGHLDAAIGSSLVFGEQAVVAATPVAATLEIARCRLSLIGTRAWDRSDRRLYTRYPRTAARLLGAATDGDWAMRTLRGCVEAALFLGLCHAIVDVVETGETIRTLRLEELRVLCQVTHEVRIRAGARELLPRLREVMPSAPWGESVLS